MDIFEDDPKRNDVEDYYEDCYEDTALLGNPSLDEPEFKHIDEDTSGNTNNNHTVKDAKEAYKKPFLSFLTGVVRRARDTRSVHNDIVHIRKKRIAFWSPVPGSGSKEMAANTAALLAKYGEGDVCVIDLDLYNPSIDYLLDVDKAVAKNSSYLNKNTVYSSLHNLLIDQKEGRCAGRDVFSYLIQHGTYKNLFAATGLYNYDSSIEVGIDVLVDFINKCYNEFDYCLLICSNCFSYNKLSEIFKSSDIVFAVMESNAYQIERVGYHLNCVNNLYYLDDSKLKIIVNKFEFERNIEIRQIYRQLGYKVAATISYNPMHNQCRSTRKLFIDTCETKEIKEYIAILDEIEYKPNKKAQRQFYK